MLFKYVMISDSELQLERDLFLPDITLGFRIHSGSNWTTELVGEFLRIGQGSNDPEDSRRVWIIHCLQLEGFGCIDRAPDLCESHEE